MNENFLHDARIWPHDARIWPKLWHIAVKFGLKVFTLGAQVATI